MVKLHKPVLLKEVIRFLNVRKGKKYIDATIGEAGHSEAILKKGGKLLGVDRDPKALGFSRKRLVSACPPSAFFWKLTKGNFAHLETTALKMGFKKVAGILFDLGVSSYQLKESQKGFSFNEDAFLDMRMDPELQITAHDLVNKLSQKDLEKLFFTFGEERYSRRIAKAICRYRLVKPIDTGSQLGQIIAEAKPRQGKPELIHPATRCFQALRIIVNDELENLKEALPQALELLERNGRLVVISFHSLEDRIVKNFLKESEKNQKLLILTKKPIRPSEIEKRQNPRSRSAKLRAAEKT